MIEIKQLTKLYKTKHQQVQAVDDISLNINKGEIFGVVGYSGAGKSTFIRLINRLEEPTSGTIKINDKDITTMAQSKLRKERQKFGMIFQHFNLLWSRTIYDNIAFPLEIAGVPKNKRKEKVLELINLVGLSGREKAYPSQLSGGQKQRVGIARALANDPDVLLCDEATSALDPETTDDILDLLVSINKKLGLTIILITHEMHVIQKICHRVAVMEKGKVVETGNVLEVFVKPQSKTTKRFVQQLNPLEQQQEAIQSFINSRDDSEVIKLHFIGNSTRRALISEISKKYDVDINILQGSISPTQEGAYGTLFFEINGQKDVIHDAIKYIQASGVEVEVLKHVE
ncbi:methionine ABC transporter ATP-binding protein [Saliterribacillus persicus]|uniref:D-methionine transport system ATP-binding protein n=1 Tax=Saliterribacillus persicus TaxID=930114 RepID=A0A368X6A6_9BACI|nr:methionine ABC transporter ATP-binding protein [Saliterribacillus persicus]RCW62518.1 D-methionine transport system ATP-binding protein [Saliterribacillus persicus]